MAKLIWSRRAIGDVQRLYRFLAKQHRDAASRAVAAIYAGVNLLERFHQGGRPAIGMDARFRDKLIAFGDSGYVARYHLDGETVTIVLVRHQRELP